MRALVLGRDPGQAASVSATLERLGYETAVATDTQAATALILSTDAFFDVAVCSLGRNEAESWPVMAALLSDRYEGAASHVAFPIVLSRTAASDVRLRLRCFAAGAKMVTASLGAVEDAATLHAECIGSQGHFVCPACLRNGLSSEALSVHVSMHHASEPNIRADCPICMHPTSEPLPVHLNHEHGPAHLREPPPPDFAAFVWVVCRRADGRFLLVNEPAGICSTGQPAYWLPAGRLDCGECLEEAGARECMEEAGVRVVITGVLRFSFGRGGVPRIVLKGAPEDEQDVEPKVRVRVSARATATATATATVRNGSCFSLHACPSSGRRTGCAHALYGRT